MEFVNVLVAGISAFMFGAVWYSVLAKQWMAVSGVDVVDGKPANNSDPIPYITGLISAVIVAGMIRHVFVRSGIEGIGRGALYGAELGLFIAVPWMATCYGFAGRARSLLLIDGGYATFGCAVIGTILMAF